MNITKFVDQLTRLKKLNSIKFRSKGGYMTTHYLNTAFACEQFVDSYRDYDIIIKDFNITRSKNGYNVEIIQEGENENN